MKYSFKAKHGRLSLAVCVLGFFGAAGYLLRFVATLFDGLGVGEALVFGLLPALLVAAYGVTVQREGLSPKLTVAPVCAMAVYQCVLSVVNNLQTASSGTHLGGSATDEVSVATILLSVFVSCAAPLAYSLAVLGVTKAKKAAVVVQALSAAIYAILVFSTYYMYSSSGESFGSYYGYIGATAGMFLYSVGMLLYCAGGTTEKNSTLKVTNEE